MLYKPTAPERQDHQLRHRCRNPKCRLKLKSPTENFRDAFCCAGCHTSYYRHRCLACEREMPRNAENQKVCYRAECKTAWRQKTVISRFIGQGTASVGDPPRSAHFTGLKTGLNRGSDPGRSWHQVAGPTLTSESFAAAVLPDGPNGQWKSGSFERIEAENRRALKAHFAKLKVAEQAEIEANGEFTEPEWREVTSPDGVVCFVTRFCDPGTPAATKTTSPIPDDLSIPAFLDRRVGDERR